MAQALLSETLRYERVEDPEERRACVSRPRNACQAEDAIPGSPGFVTGQFLQMPRSPVVGSYGSLPERWPKLPATPFVARNGQLLANAICRGLRSRMECSSSDRTFSATDR